MNGPDGLPIHASGEHPWLTACGQDKANVRQWTDRPDVVEVTCRPCAKHAARAEARPGVLVVTRPGAPS